MGQAQPQSNTLYVGDIPKEASQQEIWQHFLQWGNVMGVQLVNRSNNADSSNFAFVTFGSNAEASNARERSDHSVLLGKEIRVQFKTNAGEFQADANLFFNNLSKSMSAKALESECENFGRVMSCKLKYDSDGVPIGYGYVQFEDKEDAARCIEGLNGKILNDKAISVSKFVQRSKRAANLNPNLNLYIRNFPADWDEPKINSFIGDTFKKFGETQSIGICKDKIRSRYYAFVAYFNEDEARAANDELNDEQIPGYEEKLFVNFAKSKRQFKMEQLQKFIQQPTNLYIKWLRSDATKEQIQNAFEIFGTVTSVCLKENITNTTLTMNANLPQNYALNFAFVNYANPDDAKTALTWGKNNDIIKDLLDPEWHKTKQEFLYYAQNKTHRLSYLKAKRKKKNQMSSFENMATLMEQLQTNPAIQKQLMKLLESQGVQLPGGTKGPMGNFFGGSEGFGGSGGFGSGNTPMPNQPFSTRPPKQWGNDYGNKESYSKYGPRDGGNKYGGDNKSGRGGFGGGRGGKDQGGFNNNMNFMMNNMGMNAFSQNKMGMGNMMNNMGNFGGMSNPMSAQGITGIPGMPHNMPNMMGMGGNSTMGGNQNQGGRGGMNSANNYFGSSGQKSTMDNFQKSNSQQGSNQMGGMYPGMSNTTPAVRDYEWLKNNEEEFMSLSSSDQKTILGNTLYPKISQLLNGDESMVPKVTGMLVDMDTLSVADIRYMIDSADELRARVQEAIEIFQDENRNDGMGMGGDYN